MAIKVVPNVLAYNVPGTYQYVVPPNITYLELDGIAAGAAGCSGSSGGNGAARGGGGGGGGSGYRVTKPVFVTPGEVLTIVIPAGGKFNTSTFVSQPGGDLIITRANGLVAYRSQGGSIGTVGTSLAAGIGGLPGGKPGTYGTGGSNAGHSLGGDGAPSYLGLGGIGGKPYPIGGDWYAGNGAPGAGGGGGGSSGWNPNDSGTYPGNGGDGYLEIKVNERLGGKISMSEIYAEFGKLFHDLDFLTAGIHNFVIPDYVFLLEIEGYGAGGGASGGAYGSGTTIAPGGYGGQAGQYKKFRIPVVPGKILKLDIGTGGTNGIAGTTAGGTGTAGTAGNSTRIYYDDVLVATIAGGVGGAKNAVDAADGTNNDWSVLTHIATAGGASSFAPGGIPGVLGVPGGNGTLASGGGGGYGGNYSKKPTAGGKGGDGLVKIHYSKTNEQPVKDTLISNYYRSGLLVPNISENANVPVSGKVSLSNYYGASIVHSEVHSEIAQPPVWDSGLVTVSGQGITDIVMPDTVKDSYVDLLIDHWGSWGQSKERGEISILNSLDAELAAWIAAGGGISGTNTAYFTGTLPSRFVVQLHEYSAMVIPTGMSIYQVLSTGEIVPYTPSVFNRSSANQRIFLEVRGVKGMKVVRSDGDVGRSDSPTGFKNIRVKTIDHTYNRAEKLVGLRLPATAIASSYDAYLIIQ